MNCAVFGGDNHLLEKYSAVTRHMAIFAMLALVSACGMEVNDPAFELSGPNYTETRTSGDGEIEREWDSSLGVSGSTSVEVSDQSEIYFESELEYSRVIRGDENGQIGLTGLVGQSYSTDLADLSVEMESSSDADKVENLFDEGSLDVTFGASRSFDFFEETELSADADYVWSKDLADGEKSEEVSVGFTLIRDYEDWATIEFGPTIGFDPGDTSEINTSLELGINMGWDVGENGNFSLDLDLSRSWDGGERTDEFSFSPSATFEWTF